MALTGISSRLTPRYEGATSPRDLSILQIVPTRTVEPDGLGDYATLLASALDKSAGLSSVFLQGTPANATPLRSDCWPTKAVSACSANILVKTLSELIDEHSAIAVILHVSPYGYQKRGVPMWLASGLSKWKWHAGSVPLVAIFHELWASGSSPLKSSFWLSPAQRFITRSLHGLSDVAITTTQLFKRLLDAGQKQETPPVTVANVFSNVGEPSSVPKIEERPPRLVVFGGDGMSVVARKGEAELCRIIEAAMIREIVQVGKQKQQMPTSVLGIPVDVKGMLPPHELSQILKWSRLGVLPYGNRSVLGKSGILAAYAAHGVVPVALHVTHEDSDGLEASVNYLVASNQLVATDNLEAMQQKILAWYRGHSLTIQAQQLAAIIRHQLGAS